MARNTNADLSLPTSIELTNAERGVILEALKLKDASLRRFIKQHPAGTGLHVAYSEELDKLLALAAKF